MFVPFSPGNDGRGASLTAVVTVREKNSSEASKLERDSKEKSLINSTYLKS